MSAFLHPPIRSLIRPLAGVAAVLGLFVWTACFTEVGNPDEETGMTARVRVAYDAPDTGNGPDSVRLSSFRLRFLGAKYPGPDSAEIALWPSRDGKDLDFVREETLPRVALDHVPQRIGIRLGSSPAAGIVAGDYWRGGTAIAFRFALPDTLQFSLRYDSLSLAAWKTNGDYACSFVFFARRWLSLPGLDTAAVTDSAGVPLAVFDAQHNPDLHRALLQRFYHAFNGPRDYAAKPAGP